MLCWASQVTPTLTWTSLNETTRNAVQVLAVNIKWGIPAYPRSAMTHLAKGTALYELHALEVTHAGEQLLLH